MEKLTAKHRMIIAATAILCITALLLVFQKLPLPAWKQSRTPVNVTAVPLNSINKPIHISRTGSTANAQSVPVKAAFAGVVNEIYVPQGQTVKAGQPLLKLQPSAKQPETQPAGASSQTQASYDNALNEFNRYKKLYEIGAISRRQLEASEAHLQKAKENLSGTPNTAQANIPTTPITMYAPIDGIVTAISTAPGQSVQAGQQLISLGSGQEVEVVVNLEQNDLYQVNLGTPVTLIAAQQTIAGQVSRIYPRVEANQIPSFQAHIKLANYPAGLLKPGMQVNAHIDTGQSSVVLAAPTAAVYQDSHGQHFVYLAVDGKALLQKISIGETVGGFIEITSSLPPQSLVITSNVNELKNDDPVIITQ